MWFHRLKLFISVLSANSVVSDLRISMSRTVGDFHVTNKTNGSFCGAASFDMQRNDIVMKQLSGYIKLGWRKSTIALTVGSVL